MLQQNTDGIGAVAMDQQKRIMLVDDERDILAVLVRVLQLKGYSVTAFASPIEALKDFQTNATNYDLVIADIRMPEMTGFELVTQLKGLRPEIKMLLMSAYEVDRADLKNYPIEGYLDKPLTPTMVSEIIQKHLGSDSSSGTSSEAKIG